MSVRTDLAIENENISGGKLPEGVLLDYEKKGELKIEHIKIVNENGAKIMGREQGNYITFTLPSFASSTTLKEEDNANIASMISSLLPKEGTVLVVGLGNINITPDSIGPKAVDKVIATRHLTELPPVPLEGFRSVAAIATGVLGQTGVETAEIIRAVVEKIKPVAVIAIDALAAGSVDRLGCTLQVSDTGISPGAGVQNRRTELSEKTLGIPVIAMGIPTVVDASIIISDTSDEEAQKIVGEPMMVTPRDVDLLAQRGADTVAMTINLALQEGLTQSDIAYLNC